MKIHDPIQRNLPEWEPPPLWASLSGHLALGVVKVPIVFLLLWVSTLPGWLQDGSLGTLFLVAIGVVVVSEILTTFAERPLVIKRRLSSPGGWDYALLPLLIQAAVGVAMGYAAFGSLREGYIVAASYIVTTTVEVAIMRPWLPGDTQAQHDEKWQQTKDMTRETFEDDIREIKRRTTQNVRDKHYRRK